MSFATFYEYQETAWKEFTLAISGAPVVKIRGFGFYIESDDEELHAQGDEAISIQSGNIKKEGRLKVLKGVVDDLLLAVQKAGGRYITDARITLTCNYQPAPGRRTITHTLGGVKISKMPFDWEQGAKYMEMELPFKFLKFKAA